MRAAGSFFSEDSLCYAGGLSRARGIFSRRDDGRFNSFVQTLLAQTLGVVPFANFSAKSDRIHCAPDERNDDRVLADFRR